MPPKNRDKQARARARAQHLQQKADAAIRRARLSEERQVERLKKEKLLTEERAEEKERKMQEARRERFYRSIATRLTNWSLTSHAHMHHQDPELRVGPTVTTVEPNQALVCSLSAPLPTTVTFRPFLNEEMKKETVESKSDSDSDPYWVPIVLAHGTIRYWIDRRTSCVEQFLAIPEATLRTTMREWCPVSRDWIHRIRRLLLTGNHPLNHMDEKTGKSRLTPQEVEHFIEFVAFPSGLANDYAETNALFNISATLVKGQQQLQKLACTLALDSPFLSVNRFLFLCHWSFQRIDESQYRAWRLRPHETLQSHETNQQIEDLLYLLSAPVRFEAEPPYRAAAVVVGVVLAVGMDTSQSVPPSSPDRSVSWTHQQYDDSIPYDTISNPSRSIEMALQQMGRYEPKLPRSYYRFAVSENRWRLGLFAPILSTKRPRVNIMKNAFANTFETLLAHGCSIRDQLYIYWTMGLGIKSRFGTPSLPNLSSATYSFLDAMWRLQRALTTAQRCEAQLMSNWLQYGSLNNQRAFNDDRRPYEQTFAQEQLDQLIKFHCRPNATVLSEFRSRVGFQDEKEQLLGYNSLPDRMSDFASYLYTFPCRDMSLARILVCELSHHSAISWPWPLIVLVLDGLTLNNDPDDFVAKFCKSHPVAGAAAKKELSSSVL